MVMRSGVARGPAMGFSRLDFFWARGCGAEEGQGEGHGEAGFHHGENHN
jgi:hypothetical protein